MKREDEWWKAAGLNAVICVFVVFLWLGVFQFGQIMVWCMLKIKALW